MLLVFVAVVFVICPNSSQTNAFCPAVTLLTQQGSWQLQPTKCHDWGSTSKFLGSPCFTCFWLKQWNFAPEFLCLKLDQKIKFLLRGYIFSLQLLILSPQQVSEFSCLIGKLIWLKISSPKFENHFNQKIETSTFFPGKKVVGLTIWDAQPSPPSLNKKSHVFTTWTNLLPKNKQFALEKWLEDDS